VRRQRKWGISLLLMGAAVSLVGCETEYHGPYSGIDSTLWRQVAYFEDPLSRNLYHPAADEPIGYLDALQGQRWDGSPKSASNLQLRNGGVVLFEDSATATSAALSIFIASGPRPNFVSDTGGDYQGPSQVFTCYRVEATFFSGEEPYVEEVNVDDCPNALVEMLPDDAAFASADVFDG
jgi:hypothetical protein